MPFLDWSASSLKQNVVESPAPARTQLVLRISPAERDQLATALEKVYSGAGGELRLDLPSKWIVFWKEREGESRLLIAHPEQREWVATVALLKEHGKILVEALRKLKPDAKGDAKINVGWILPVGKVSNLELLISLG